MNIQYLKQAWYEIKQHPFYSTVYIVGTGLAISMVMVIAIVFYIGTADLAPETSRSKLVYYSQMEATIDAKQWYSRAQFSYYTIKECFYNLQTPETVTATISHHPIANTIGEVYVNIPGSQDLYSPFLKGTDHHFWKVFRFSFISGNPLTEEEFQSGLPIAIISESFARKLFKTTDVKGKTLLINDLEFIVGGVVKDVSTTMSLTFSDIWIPFTSISQIRDFNYGDEGTVGLYQVYVKAKNRKDFSAIEKEVKQKEAILNSKLREWQINIFPPQNNISYRLKQLDSSVPYTDLIRKYLFLSLLFLLVPAINLSGLISSRMQDKKEELGIRKAFGANRLNLIVQVFTENLVMTLMGGLVGLLLSWILILSLKENLLAPKGELPDVQLSIGMLMNYTLFFITLGICLFLNILSSLFPVWNASGKSIIDSFNDN